MLALDHYYEICPALAVDAGPNATGFSKPQELNLNQHSDPSLALPSGTVKAREGLRLKNTAGHRPRVGRSSL